jgi:hypothetical protein
VTARSYTVAEARRLLPHVIRHAQEFIAARADATELMAALQSGRPSPLGGMPEAKALEARLDEILSWFTGQGLQVKGIAPLLVDFVSELDGEPVLLCWLEGETELAWYHRPEHGFAGRRRLPHDAMP